MQETGWGTDCQYVCMDKEIQAQADATDADETQTQTLTHMYTCEDSMYKYRHRRRHKHTDIDVCILPVAEIIEGDLRILMAVSLVYTCVGEKEEEEG